MESTEKITEMSPVDKENGIVQVSILNTSTQLLKQENTLAIISLHDINSTMIFVTIFRFRNSCFQLTKKGENRKRRIFNLSKAKRIELKRMELKRLHILYQLPGKIARSALQNFQKIKGDINRDFWNMFWKERKTFVISSTQKKMAAKKQKTQKKSSVFVSIQK